MGIAGGVGGGVVAVLTTSGIGGSTVGVSTAGEAAGITD
jgi:hypothetical protein